jgi:hypothetical protein
MAQKLFKFLIPLNRKKPYLVSYRTDQRGPVLQNFICRFTSSNLSKSKFGAGVLYPSLKFQGELYTRVEPLRLVTLGLKY